MPIAFGHSHVHKVNHPCRAGRSRGYRDSPAMTLSKNHREIAYAIAILPIRAEGVHGLKSASGYTCGSQQPPCNHHERRTPGDEIGEKSRNFHAAIIYA
jgi:hypothetical protein